jgi:hypothetical protein
MSILNDIDSKIAEAQAIKKLEEKHNEEIAKKQEDEQKAKDEAAEHKNKPM